MLKRYGLIFLLGCQLGWAAPTPQSSSLTILEQPGSSLAPRQVEQLLEQYEKALGSSPSAQIEVECCRLLPLLRRMAPGCPARVAQLRQKIQQLPTGMARARCYWVLCWDAVMRNQPQEVERNARLALAEPGFSPLQKAFWMDSLDEAYCGRLPAPLRDSMIAEVASLHKLTEKPGLLYVLLCLRARTATLQGNQELKKTLLLAAEQLAQKQGWLEEQMNCRLNARAPGEKDEPLWRQLLTLVLRQPPSAQRDVLLGKLAQAAPGLAQWKQAAAQLQKPLSPLEEQNAQLRFLKGEARLEACARLLRRFQQAGDNEGEIVCRRGYSDALEESGQLEASIRQLQAALQCRQDHPLEDPDWTAQTTENLVQMLCRKLEKCGRTQQQLTLARQALQQGWIHTPVVQTELHLQLCQAAQACGDGQQELEHWEAALQRVRYLPADIKGFVLLTLAQSAPAGKSQLTPELLKQARAQAESVLHSQSNAVDRGNALATLLLILKQQQDTPARIRLLQEEMQRARQVGDRQLLSDSSQSLLQLLNNPTSLPQLRELARERLQDPALSNWERASIYSLAPVLAGAQDPESLIWADEGVQLARQHNLGQWKPARALASQARVLAQFGRTSAAQTALQEAEMLRPGGSLGLELVQARAEVLWKQGRQQEALQGLRTALEQLLTGEQPALALPGLRDLVQRQEQLGLDWQADLEHAMEQLQALGERGSGAQRQLLYDWLQKLAQQKKWQQGRELLQRHPWGSGMEPAYRSLQQVPQWQDLLPASSARSEVDPESLPALVDSLRLSNPELGTLLTLRSTNLKQLQSRLQPQDTLVTYCRRGDDLYVLILRHNGGSWHKTAISSQQVNDLLARSLVELNGPIPGVAESTLQATLLDGVIEQSDRPCLYLVPTGELWQIPFAALRDAQGRSTFSRADIVLLSSGDLLRLADKSWQPYRLSQPLAIGAPSADDLPEAYRELEEVARVLPGCTLRRGREATREVLYDPQQRWGLLHFASHARYNLRHPLESELEFTDGPLKLKQLSQLSLAERSLVTLSCCQGGSSQGQTLDEPVTLATGFSAAGADTVVANLWAVEDAVARVFFSDFYRHLASGASPLASFRHAQQSCRDQFPQARDWGGFFLLGNPT